MRSIERTVSADFNRIVKLNVGGVLYLTTEQTLLHGENFFSGLLGGKIPSLKDSNDYYFIDRNGEIFGYLLEFMRSGRWRFPSHVDESDILSEANFYQIDVHRHFAPLSDAALCSWLEQRQSSETSKTWSRIPELAELKELILGAFRREQAVELGDVTPSFEFIFYPEVEGGSSSISNFISKLLAEDEVSPEHRKVIDACKTQLSKIDFKSHPYYPLPIQQWKVLGLPQCQTLLMQHMAASLLLSIDFKMSRIGVARVEKRMQIDGASLYRVHDFYPLNGLEYPRSLQSTVSSSYNVDAETIRGVNKTLRQQFDRCVSAIVCHWSYRALKGVKSPKLSRRGNEEPAMMSSSPPLEKYQNL